MTQTISELEQDIEEARARLDITIEKLQGKLTVSGLVDEVIASTGASNRVSPAVGTALDVVRRNPIPVVVLAAGIGWLIYRLNQDAAARERYLAEGRLREERGLPVISTGHARVYDPDLEPRHPPHDALEGSRDMSARA